jgi:dihydrodipicolinate synthase/N-acetylneuraminate lyase
MVSPFTDDGAIDQPAVARIVEHLFNARIPGVFVLGTTGEAMSIHPQEKAKLVECTAKSVAGRMTVYAGISGNCLRESIESAKLYKQLGAAALVAHPPHYFAVPDRDFELYLRKLADAVPLPLLLYNMPQTTHVSIPLDMLGRLSSHPNIVGIKDSAKDADRMHQLLQQFGGREAFSVLAGNSIIFTQALRDGVDGLVPSGANLEPQPYQALFEAAKRQQWADVQRLQEQTDAISARYVQGRLLGESLAALKALMAARGLCGKAVLPPLTIAG